MSIGENLTPAMEASNVVQGQSIPQPQEGIPNFFRSRIGVATALLAAWAIRDYAVMPSVALAQEGQTCTTTTYPDGSFTTECVAGGADTGQEQDTSDPDTNQSTPDNPSQHNPNNAPATGNKNKQPKKEKAPKKQDAKTNPRLSERQQAAKSVIRLIHEGKIVIQPLKGGKHELDLKSHSTPMDNLESALAGNPSKTSTRCKGVGAPKNKDAYINPKILEFLSETGKQVKMRVTAIVGGCHHPGSNHYAGDAIDIGCKDGKMPARQESIMQRVAKRIGLKRFTGESCEKEAHEHFSVDGH